MSFARAFSTRRRAPELEVDTPAYIGRAASQRNGKPVLRAQISSPVALIATTNGQINYAHRIAGAQPIEIRHVSSESTSSSSSDESDTSMVSMESMTDASSIEESPISSEPEPNHLTSYFKPAVDTHKRSSSTRSPAIVDSARTSLDTPRIPERAPSHSKRAHEGLHRKRSIQRMLSPPPTREIRDSAAMFLPSTPITSTFVEAPKENPFGNELAQLDEVAEEYGQVVRDAEAVADALYMESHGLARFGASDYMFEIQSLIHQMFADERSTPRDMGGFF